MKFMFGLQHPLTCKPWTNFSNPCNKVRGKYVVKEVFLRFPSCVVCSCIYLYHASVLLLCRCDAAWTCKWLYNMWSTELLRYVLWIFGQTISHTQKWVSYIHISSCPSDTLHTLNVHDRSKIKPEDSKIESLMWTVLFGFKVYFCFSMETKTLSLISLWCQLYIHQSYLF